VAVLTQWMIYHIAGGQAFFNGAIPRGRYPVRPVVGSPLESRLQPVFEARETG
jgi:hypothetical protein